MSDKFFADLEAFLEGAGIDGPEARALCRAVHRGEPVDLPEATTPEGAMLRTEIQSQLAVQASILNGSGAPSSGDAGASRRVVVVAPGAGPASPDLIAAMFADRPETGGALVAAGATIDDARIARKALDSQFAELAKQARPAIPTIEQRSQELPTFGSTFTPMSSKDRARAGWKAATDAANARRD